VLELADALRASLSVPVSLRRLSEVNPPAALPFERLERRLCGPPAVPFGDWIPTADMPPAGTCRTASLVISAVERNPRELVERLPQGPVLVPTFEGGYRLDAVFAALVEGRPPVIGVEALCGTGARRLFAVEVAVPAGNLFSRSVAALLARVILCLQRAVEHCLIGKPLPAGLPATTPHAPASPRFYRIGQRYLEKLGWRVCRPFMRQDWCIGYRRVAPGGNLPFLEIDESDFTIIRSDEVRFYADPIVFRHNDSTTIFFEDLASKTGLGRISYTILGDDGSWSQPAEALSRPYHLSYPFVFCDAGQVFMIPETSSNRTVELYEAVRFPDQWRLRSILLDDIHAADATVFFDEQAQIWWMFAAVAEHGGGDWDTLSIFFSANLDGPWRPHAGNPVKLDPRSSRSAGPIIALGTQLFRPAQDCSAGYGTALAWCEIKELTPDNFREEVVARIAPKHGYAGIHTYSRAAGYEVIDLKRKVWWRLPLARRLGYRMKATD